MYYETQGKGRPIIMIHDGLVHRRIWDGQFSFFAQSFQVVRYDRQGYGRSERPQSDYSNVSDLDALLQHLEIESAILMGVSAGGMEALDFALAHDDKVDAMILIGPGLGGYPASDHMQNRIMTAIKPLIEDDDFDQTIENWVNDPYLVAAENGEAREKLRKYLTAHPHNLSDPHWHSFEEPGKPAIERLAEITAPTLVVMGESDIADNHAVSGILEVGLPNAQRVVIPNAAHLANLEQPEVFNTLAGEFLGETLTQ